MYIDDLARAAVLTAFAEAPVTEQSLVQAEKAFLYSFAADAQSEATAAWDRALEYATAVAKGEIEPDASLTAAEGAALLLERRGPFQD